MAYIVLELQTNRDDTLGSLIWNFPTLPQAESKFHAILSAAAISSIPIHSAVILDERGENIAYASYDHPIEETV